MSDEVSWSWADEIVHDNELDLRTSVYSSSIVCFGRGLAWLSVTD